MLALCLFGSMMVLFAISVPIAFSIGLAAAGTLWAMMPHVSLEVVVQRMFHGLNSFVLLAVPLFLLLGDLMEATKITDRLVEFARALVGWLRGGLGHVAIITNMIMAGISGSGTADAAATGVVLIPMMTKAGYSTPFSAALIGAAATIGPIIPPSIIMVVYASIANVSVGRLFLGGMIPGILMGVSLMAFTALRAHRSQLQVGEPLRARQLLHATSRAALVLVTPLIVIVGIIGGIFTATESAGVACVYALVLGLAVYRTVTLRKLPAIFAKTMMNSGKVMFVMATASVFSWILARGNVPAQIAQLPGLGEGAKSWMVLCVMNLLLLVLGCLMDSVAILLVFTPMIMPIAQQAGIDPVHLGVMMAVNLSIGLVTPPFGSAMFVLCGISGCRIPDFSRNAWPFILALVLVLALITYVPAVTLFLPNLIMGGS